MKNVTLCAIDHVAHDLTRLALERCLKHFDFADVVVLSDKDILPGSTHVQTELTDSTDAELFLTYLLPDYVKTDHFLYVQWDSWIINPAMWTNDWLQYDYIGAPWPQNYIWPNCNPEYNIGNGGFSLRSMRLAEAMRSVQPYLPSRDGSCVTNTFYSPEDHCICVANRERLQNAGCKWPTTQVAERFSVELKWPKFTPFGFHGAFQFMSVLGPDEFFELVPLMPPYVREGKGMQAVRRYLDALPSENNDNPFPAWCGPLKAGWSCDSVQHRFHRLFHD